MKECYYCKNYIPHDTPNCPHCKSREPLPLARTYVGPGLGMVAFALAGLLFIPPYRGVPWTGFIICMAVAFLFACNFVIGMVGVIKVVPARRLMRRYKRHKRHNFTDSCHCLYCGKLNLHDWDGCICTRCGARRDKEHDWDGCICRRCGKTRDEERNGCTCRSCGKTRDEGHQWVETGCPNCDGTGFVKYESSGGLSYGDLGYGHPLEEPCQYHQPVTIRCAICGKEKDGNEAL